MGIKTVMITGDNPLTAGAIAAEAGVDDFLAEATPEAKLALIREYQKGGRLVAMTSDGTNDAPALAQADVAVAMNSGTQAAKEAGNMVDLDSNPTKLIEIVHIGKHLLMTRGALTTFSIANDVAKYFAILPAAFAATYPELKALDLMGLSSPSNAILSAVIFNALIIVALVPLALKGVAYRPVRASVQLRDNLLIYGLGGLIVPFVGIKLLDLTLPAFTFGGSPAMYRTTIVSIRLLIVLTFLTGILYPLTVTSLARVFFPARSSGSLIREEGRILGSELIGQQFASPDRFWGRLSATARVPYDAAASSGSNLGPLNPDLKKTVEARISELKAHTATSDPIPVDLVTASASGLDPHISPAAAAWQIPRFAAASGISQDRLRQLVAEHTSGRFLGILGEPRVNVLRLNRTLDRFRTAR